MADTMKRILAFACVCLLFACFPLVSAQRGVPATAAAQLQAQVYVGSDACASCHASVYNRWVKTRMANVVRDLPAVVSVEVQTLP